MATTIQQNAMLAKKTAANKNTVSGNDSLDETKDKKDAKIALVQNYLNSVRSIIASFVQVGHRSSVAYGKFFLKKPGQMRLDYVFPNKGVLLSNRSKIIYYDRELREYTTLPKSNPWYFLMKAYIDLKKEVRIISVSENKGTVRITISLKTDPDAGQLTIVLSKDPVIIRQLVLTESSGKRIQVTLQDIEIDATIQDKVFQDKDYIVQ